MSFRGASMLPRLCPSSGMKACVTREVSSEAPPWTGVEGPPTTSDWLSSERVVASVPEPPDVPPPSQPTTRAAPRTAVAARMIRFMGAPG